MGRVRAGGSGRARRFRVWGCGTCGIGRPGGRGSEGVGGFRFAIR
jgi:hypothetical protein